MAIRDRTTVFEMRAMVEPEHEAKLTPSKVDRYPHRDIDALVEAITSSESVQEAAHELDCRDYDVYTWSDIYGLDVDALLVGGGNDV